MVISITQEQKNEITAKAKEMGISASALMRIGANTYMAQQETIKLITKGDLLDLIRDEMKKKEIV